MIFAEESSRPEDRRCLRFKCSSFYELNAVNTLAVHDLSAVNDYILRFKYSSTRPFVPGMMFGRRRGCVLAVLICLLQFKLWLIELLCAKF
jgi:hypothetical protein